jgi:hypothetical protein
MGAQIQIEEASREMQLPHWSFLKRLAFRFCFSYFGLYCLTTQILGGLFFITKFSIDAATLWPMRQITLWTAVHIFGITHPLVYTGSGSGDKTFNWVGTFCLLILAVLATGIWSVLDPQRDNYVTLDKWFRLFIRFALASEMFSYGMVKIFPLQMPFPFLTRFVEPFGNFSPMGVLWNFVGSSPVYEIFAGCAEILGGILLIVHRTTMLGMLICLADLTYVFLLNMTYDVPVKLLSFHLILMGLFLLFPELPRLVNFFFLNRAVGPSTQPQLFRTRRANGINLVVQLIFAIYLVGTNVYMSWSSWYAYGGGRPKSLFYGIWNVDQLSVDGHVRSPLLTDYDRWRRVIFDFPTSVNFQRMDDSFVGYGTTVNLNDRTIALTKANDRNYKAKFTFQCPAPDQMTLDGDMDDHKLSIQLRLVDRNKFLLVNSGFHWIAEYPFNRLEVRR